jgi:hypothetical protein
MSSGAATVSGRQRSPRGAGADCRTRKVSVTDFYGIQAGTIPGFAEAGGGIFISVTGLPDRTVRNMITFMDKLRGIARARPAGVRSVFTARRVRNRGPAPQGGSYRPAGRRRPLTPGRLAHSASSVSTQRLSVTAATKRSSARSAPALLARHGAAQRLAGCRRRHQSLASFAHGSVIRIRRAPKSTTKVASSWLLIMRPRPYL